MKSGLILKGLIAICAMVWVGNLLSAGTITQPQVRALLGPFGLVALVADLLLLGFDRWFWAWPGISMLVKRPDLRGTWRGELVSEWKDPATGASLPPIPVFACVTQTANTLHLRQFTKESGSLTISAALTAQADDVMVFTATYQNEPNVDVRHRSQIHFGAFRLYVAGDSLTGTYWTDRNTRGSMKFSRVSGKKCQGFEHAGKLEAQHLATLHSASE